MKYLIIIILNFYSVEVINSSLINRNIYDYISNDELLIASTIQSECNYCSDYEKDLIISSILNRCDNENYPVSITSVLSAYSIKNNEKISEKNIKKVIYFNNRNYNVFYFFNPKKSTNKLFIKKIRKITNLIYKSKHHEYRGN